MSPRAASARKYLRDGLPAVYLDSELTMGFVAALEEVLDPVVCLLDCLPAHLDPELAPDDLLGLLGAWLGFEADQLEPERLRRVVGESLELARMRGTCPGVQHVLDLCFPELGLRVHDQGGVSWSADVQAPPAPPPAFEVRCDKPLADDQRAAVERILSQFKPAHVAHRLIGGAGA